MKASLGRRAALSLLLATPAACTRVNRPTSPEALPRLEVVQSVPAETHLATHGIPHADAVLVDMIDAASRRIDIAQFYVSEATGKWSHTSRLGPIMAALARASERGVRIRVLVDGMLAEQYETGLARLRALGATLRVTSAFRPHDGVQHAKYWLVDDGEIFLGSQNFDWRALDQIHEIGIRLRGSRTLSAFLEQIFEHDFASAKAERPPPLPQAPVRERLADGRVLSLAYSPQRDAGAAWDLPLLEGGIDQAKKRLFAELLLYSTHTKQAPFTALEAALIRARKRGVDVRLLLSDWGIRKGGKARDSIARLLEHGVTIHIVQIPDHTQGRIPFARTIHAKYMIADDAFAWVGSSNWEEPYFFAGRNVGLVMEGPGACRDLERVFHRVETSRYAKPARAVLAEPELPSVFE